MLGLLPTRLSQKNRKAVKKQYERNRKAESKILGAYPRPSWNVHLWELYRSDRRAEGYTVSEMGSKEAHKLQRGDETLRD